jgi:uncharacterized circularly permuted ATP-grasp superfamily protein/uncharacterized alpha-E superfamily protein
MVSGQGKLRTHWQSFMGTMGPIDPGDMAERWEEARRLLHQNGVTYNIYGDPKGMERPWPLDMVPLLLPAGEWKEIEAGLTQRATLLNGVLADFYGPQSLIREGRVPPALLHSNSSFCRPAHGIRPPRDVYLHFYAADLARGPDGHWRVLSDRTQAPSGGGYALENRAVMGRLLPDAFRHCRAERLAPFFDTFKATLAGLAPRTERPRVVLLTPGPYNETYFEHVFLARHMGLTLVEGADLTVRDRKVFLKTLSGLEPVDVIMRRLDDDFCDPLELRADSSLGVAGLMEAVRAGNVAVANALGSAVTESLSFKSILPELCRHLLGDELRMHDVPSWWCGTEAGCAHVLANLDRMVIKSAVPKAHFVPIFGADLSAAKRAALAGCIRRHPWAYAAQERMILSTAPVWEDNRLQPRPLVLRVFLCSTGDGGYVVMPGGLTRVSTENGRLIISMQHGGGSKDTWVLPPRQDEGAPAPPRSAAVVELRSGDARLASGDLPSRVADSLFWLGRYAERAEGAVRLLRGAHTRLTDGNQPGATAELVPLLGLMAWLGMIPWDLAAASHCESTAVRVALMAAVFDPDHPHSLRTSITRLHRSAYSVRDRLSLDMWRVVSQIDKVSQPPPRGRIDAAALLLLLDDLITSLAAFAGLEQESMTRGAGWRFLDMGRRVERTLHIVSVMRGIRIAEPPLMDETRAAPALEVLLELGESVMTYRQRYFASVQRAPVLELLLSDDTNPRAAIFQLAALERHLSALPQTAGQASACSPTTTALHIVQAARMTMRTAEAVRHGPTLRTLLDSLAMTLPEISNLLAHAYFSHAFARSA